MAVGLRPGDPVSEHTKEAVGHPLGLRTASCIGELLNCPVNDLRLLADDLVHQAVRRFKSVGIGEDHQPAGPIGQARDTPATGHTPASSWNGTVYSMAYATSYNRRLGP